MNIRLTPKSPTHSAQEIRTSARDSVRSFTDQLEAALRHRGDEAQPSTRGLPLATAVPPPAVSTSYYVMSPIDVWGRIADRSPVQILQWRPGRAVTTSLVDGAVTVFPHDDGPEAITRQGHLRLPASIRHVLHLHAGDRLLLLACREGGFLVAYPASAVDVMVLAHHAARPDQETP